MPSDFLAILDTSNKGKEVLFDAGQTVFRRDESVRWLYRVKRGRVRLSRVLARGSEIALARLSANEILAEASVFATHYHCDATAEAPSVLQRYPMRDVLALLKSDSNAAMSYSAYLAAQLMNLRTMSEIRGIRRADDRLLAWLRLQPPGEFDGHGIWPSVARQIGLTGESLYRALARLEAAGKIKRIDGKVKLAARSNGR
jgi:CRP/FNR family transcriptional regulator, dissimilatory nitrate respiration regulator